jgi:hypothetical protein
MGKASLAAALGLHVHLTLVTAKRSSHISTLCNLPAYSPNATLHDNESCVVDLHCRTIGKGVYLRKTCWWLSTDFRSSRQIRTAPEWATRPCLSLGCCQKTKVCGQAFFILMSPFYDIIRLIADATRYSTQHQSTRRRSRISGFFRFSL